MKILIIGSGGREYAIASRLKQNAHTLFFAPGNGATDTLGTNLDITCFEKLADYAKNNAIDLTIVGPEDPLTNGIVDLFKSKNLVIFGPSKSAARLEGSKAYMKEFLAKYGIKTAKFLNSCDYDEISKFIDSLGQKLVIKADGLCAGKGVIIANSHDEAKKAAHDMLSGDSFGEAGKRVVVEEFLDGFELSFFAICDGENFVSLPVAQDHKRVGDGDTGVNTGGMGAYAPSPLASKDIISRVERDVVAPTLLGMKRENAPFCGVLFVGLMIVKDEIYVLEYNVRFGDPECEALMPLIKGDLGEILFNAASGRLERFEIEDKFAVSVVVASRDYPYKSTPSEPISVGKIPQGCHINYAGVTKIDGVLNSSGGRVLVCVGVGDTIQIAKDRAYELVGNVKFKGSKFRTDIAYQAL